MTFEDEVADFIRSTFRSVWSLELLLHLKRHRGTAWSREDLVAALRASELIVAQSLEALIAAGLVSVDGQDCAVYLPAAADLDRLVEGTETLYGRSPNLVRRMIVVSMNEGLTAFSDAFKLRKS
jgi:hypothetical protein